MKRTDPKMIINLSISDEEFEKHIEAAVDKYIESILDSCVSEKVTNAIKKYVDYKVDAVLKEKRYTNDSTINGVSLSTYIADVARPKIHTIIAQIVSEVVSETVSAKFMKE